MEVTFTNINKALASSRKHFNNAFNIKHMKTMAGLVFNDYTMIGVSDRINPHYDEPAVILWHPFNRSMLQITVDAKDFRKGICTVLTMYDVTDVVTRIERFNMKTR